MYSRSGVISKAKRLEERDNSRLGSTNETVGISTVMESEFTSSEVKMIDRLRRLIRLEERSYMLRVPRAEENEGLMLLGDPGTGKSQVIHQLLEQIALRRPPEAVV